MASKQLHLANIANVAYGYARALRQAGREANVLCYDLTHVLSMPEWADGDFEITIENEWAPPKDHPELQRVCVPEWYSRIRSMDYWVTVPPGDRSRVVTDEWVDVLVRASQRYGSRWALKPEDVRAYKPLTDSLSSHFFRSYDVVFGYAYGAVPPLLAGMEPYVPVEIGTLRDTVNEDTPLGRLLALAYRTAPHTIITNADCLAAAHSLGMERFSYVPHPVDEDVFRPYSSEERQELKRSLCSTRHLLVAPARQFWNVKANDRYLRAFAELVRGGYDVTLLISEWGPDVARAKQYINELGVARWVKWFNPVPEGRLAKLFNAADLVLDQFGTFGTFGLIGPKAMSCGTPCLLSFDPALHDWCFSETPPVVAAREEEEILQALRQYLADDQARAALGHRSREWVLKHHSKAVVVEKMDAIVAQLTEGRLAATEFAALRQQRLLLAVAAPSAPLPQGNPSALAALPPQLRTLMRRFRNGLMRLRKLGRAFGDYADRLPPVLGSVKERMRPVRLKLARYVTRLRETVRDVRLLTQDRTRLMQLEGTVTALRADLDRERATGTEIGSSLAGLSARLERKKTALDDFDRRLMSLSGLHEAETAARKQLDEALRLVAETQRLLTAQSQDVADQLQQRSSQLQEGILGAFDLMGKNRLEDRQLLTAVRTELLEHFVRARLVAPLEANGVESWRPPQLRDPISVPEAFRRLNAAAPLNWALFDRCLNQGTESYEALPPGSCSTEAHPQALLFRAFLRPYLRGHVLDVGCGPQPVPYYLQDYPTERICGIDPISRAEDHPFQFVPGVGEYLPWDDSVFDLVVSGTTLDHYSLLDRGLESAFRVLRPGGHFVAWITEFKDAPEYDPYTVSMEAPYDAEHLFHIDRAWFLPLMRRIGFREVEVMHFELPFNYLFMSFEKPA
ncbi:MAG: methyltransferase domain-containing protein [Betaproteobacteria bacterium]|nr:methyltransferase domain-containing protein [Betaproteobacteria bacterium]